MATMDFTTKPLTPLCLLYSAGAWGPSMDGGATMGRLCWEWVPLLVSCEWSGLACSVSAADWVVESGWSRGYGVEFHQGLRNSRLQGFSVGMCGDWRGAALALGWRREKDSSTCLPQHEFGWRSRTLASHLPSLAIAPLMAGVHTHHHLLPHVNNTRNWQSPPKVRERRGTPSQPIQPQTCRCDEPTNPKEPEASLHLHPQAHG